MSASRIVAVAVLLGGCALGASMLIQDETHDEPWHLAWSRRLWDEGVTERRSSLLYNSKTPISLVNVAAEKAAASLGVRSERGRLIAARLPGLAFFALAVGLTFLLGRRLGGHWAGLAAAAAVALDPNVVAHASVATVDIPFTVATLLVVLLGLRQAEQPSSARALALGAALGLAFATKYTAALLLPMAAAALAVAGLRSRPSAAAGHAALAALATLLLIDAAYLGRGLLQPWGELAFRSALMRGATDLLAGLRLPVPADFLTGFDIVQDQDRTHPWDVNLFGPGRGPGVFYYFPACWAMKTPVALIAATLGGLARLVRRRPRAAVVAVAGSFLFLLALLSFRLRAQLGYRLGLMLLPLAVVLAAVGWSSASERVRRRGLLAVVTLSALESLPYLGNSLAFTNAFVQPKREAFRYVAGANLDWGQNDGKVKRWIEASGLDPEALEPPYLRLDDNVFSVNSMAGVSSPRRLRWAREHLEPVEHFRHTHVRLRVGAAEYERYLEEDRMLPLAAAAACALDGRIELAAGEWTRLPGGNTTWLLCVDSPSKGELRLEGRRGGGLLGHADLERRDWERLTLGEPLGYRVAPGQRTLLVFAGGQLELRVDGPPGARVSARRHDRRWASSAPR